MGDRLVLVNAARLAEVPEGTRRQSRSMTTAQARQLLASDLTVWWRAYFSLALYCGLRPGELTGLRCEGVDLASDRDDAGRPMSRQRMNVRFEEVLGAAGLGTDWQPRETRHTAISIASEHGASTEDLADMAGHVNPNVTTAVYRHVISDTVTRAPAALDQALAAGGEA
jgi:integrase